jgi:hypothetical protein
MLLHYIKEIRSSDSSKSIVTDCRLDDWGVIPGKDFRGLEYIQTSY